MDILAKLVGQQEAQALDAQALETLRAQLRAKEDELKEQTSKVEQLSKTKEELSASEAKSRKLAEELEKKVGELHQKMEDSSAATEEASTAQARFNHHRLQVERDELAQQLDAATAQLADLNRRLREGTEAEVVLRDNMVAMRKQLQEERRRLADKNFEAERLEDQLEKANKLRTQRDVELGELLVKLTTMAEALKHSSKNNEELSTTLHSALAANQRMSQCIVGEYSLEGTVGMTLQEAGIEGLGGEDVSLNPASSKRIFYVESMLEGGAAQISHRVHEEDVIVAVDDLPLDELNLSEAEALLQGPVGSKVTLRGRRGICGSEYMVTLTRIKGGGPSDLAAAACARAKQIQHDLSALEALLDLDLATRAQLRAWRLHTIRRRHHQGLLRCLRQRFRRSHISTRVLMPWHSYAREMKRRNRGVRITAHTRSKTQVAQWFRAWVSTKKSYSIHRNRGGLMLEQKRRRQLRLFLAVWIRERIAEKVLKTRLLQTVKRNLRRVLCRVLSLWRSSCASFKVFRDGYGKAGQQGRRRRLSVAFFSWRDNAFKRQRVVRVGTRAVKHVVHRCSAAAFECWHAHALEQKKMEQVCARIVKKMLHHSLYTSIRQWRERIRMELESRRLRKSARARARHSLLFGTFRLWSLHIRIKLRVARKYARLTQNSRRGLLLRVFRGVKQHLWELRAELRGQRAYCARLRLELQESMLAWVNVWWLHKRLSLAMERMLARKRWRSIRHFWRAWLHRIARIWSVLDKWRHTDRFLTREASFNCWVQQAKLGRVTRQKFSKVLEKHTYIVLSTYLGFWRLTAVEWSSFRQKAKHLVARQQQRGMRRSVRVWKRCARTSRKLRSVMTLKNRARADLVMQHWQLAMKDHICLIRRGRYIARCLARTKVLGWVIPHWLGVVGLSRNMLRKNRRLRLRRKLQVMKAWFQWAHDSLDHRQRAGRLCLRVTLGTAGANLTSWVEYVHVKRFYRLACTRAVAYRWVSSLRRMFNAWLGMTHHASHSSLLVTKVSAVIKRVFFRRGALCRDTLVRLDAARIYHQQLESKDCTLRRRVWRSMQRVFFEAWLASKHRSFKACKLTHALQAWCHRELRLKPFLKTWHRVPRMKAALRNIAHKVLKRWASCYMLRLGLYLNEAHSDRVSRDRVLLHTFAWCFKLVCNRLLRRVCRRWSVAVGRRVHLRRARWHHVLRQEKGLCKKVLDALTAFLHNAQRIAAAVLRAKQCRCEALLAASVREWIGCCKRQQRAMQAHKLGSIAKVHFAWQVVRECLKRWQQSCALRTRHGAVLHGDTAAGVAFVRCILGACEDGGKTVPAWVEHQLCGFVHAASALAVPDLVVSMGRYIRRVISKWFAFELRKIELHIYEVEDVVRHVGTELKKYRLVRIATEERLHKRIAELEAAMLAMFSQTALHAGVEEGRLIDPPLTDSSPSRARLHGYLPSALPPAPVPPVRLSQALPRSTPRPAGHEITHVGTSPNVHPSSNQYIERGQGGGHSYESPLQTISSKQGSISPLSPLSRSHLSEQQGQPNVNAKLPSRSSPVSTSNAPPRVHIRQSPGDSWSLSSPATATSITSSIISSVTRTIAHTAAAENERRSVESSDSNLARYSIGLLLEKCAEKVTVKSIATGGVADKNGLVRQGDILESFNNEDVRALSLEEIHNKIRQEGLRGTPIRLQLVRQSLPNTSVRFVANLSKSTLNVSGSATSPQMSPAGETQFQSDTNPHQRYRVWVTRDEHGGVGVNFYVGSEVEGALITKVESGSPAARALLKKGHIIHQIDDNVDVANMTAEGITGLLRGRPETDVLLTISDGSSRWDFNDDVNRIASESSSIDAEPKLVF